MTIAIGLGMEWATALESEFIYSSGLKHPLCKDGICLSVPPAIIKPYAWIGYVGFGTKTNSPGAVLADA